MDKKAYGVDAIKTLEGVEAIRTRPGMYIGSVGSDGVRHITLEIISNAIDEYLNGYCTKCRIEVEKDNTITITDNGRGVPFGRAADGSETLENIFTKLHTGAKFDSSGKTGYNTSGGMNGIGAKATNALSSKFIVKSMRDGKNAVMTFERGIRKNFKITPAEGEPVTGTIITFRPDEEIFKEGIELDKEALRKQLKELSYLSPGLEFRLGFKGEWETIISENGIYDYIQEINKNKDKLTDIFYTESFDNRIGVKVAMQYNNSYSDNYHLFTNSIPNSGGTHLTGFRMALTQSINEYARANKLLKEKDENITGEELKEGLTLVLSFIMPDPVFSGQTKDVLSSSEGRTVVQRLVGQELKVWFAANPSSAKAIIEKALLARKAREKAKKAKEAVRNVETKGKSKWLNLPTKLTDCWGKDRTKCELFISEGDSAANGLIAARNGETQAVFPIRGKIISVRKTTTEKIYANQEVSNIVKALGLEIDKKTNRLIYDSERLRYGKIIFAADGDPDGENIKALLITCFWWLCPELFLNGHIHVAVPPLFRITTKKNEYIYLRDKKELEQYKETHKGDKFLINRAKGLGEQDSEELEVCLLNPKTRNVQEITVDSYEKAEELLDILMGSEVSGRREYLLKYGEEADID